MASEIHPFLSMQPIVRGAMSFEQLESLPWQQEYVSLFLFHHLSLPQSSRVLNPNTGSRAVLDREAFRKLLFSRIDSGQITPKA